MLLQKELIEKQMGVSDAEIQKGKEIFKGAYEIITSSKSNDENLKNEVENYFKSKINTDQSTANNFAAQLTKPWMYNSLKLDPIIFLQKVKCPVLAINGSKDLQVPAEVNLNSIKKTLDEAGNKKVTVKILPNLNHLFQECTTGLPTEYGTIEQTISPIALEEISNWLLLQIN